MAKDKPKRVLQLIDQADGTMIPSVNITALHGVLSTLKLKETGDIKQALAVRNRTSHLILSYLILAVMAMDWLQQLPISSRLNLYVFRGRLNAVNNRMVVL